MIQISLNAEASDQENDGFSKRYFSVLFFIYYMTGVGVEITQVRKCPKVQLKQPIFLLNEKENFLFF